MSPELDALAREADGVAQTEAAKIDMPAPSGGYQIELPEEQVRAAQVAVHRLGNVICARARVTPLEPEESTALSIALLNVAKVYGWLDQADPRIMSLITLGGVTLGIISNRQRLPPPPQPRESDAAAQPAN